MPVKSGVKPRFIRLLSLLFAVTACDRDMTEPTANLTVTNNYTLAIWSVHVAPTVSPTERGMDLLASMVLDAAASRTFTLDTCGQAIDVVVRFSNGAEQAVSSVAAVNCNATYTCDIDVAGIMVCN